MLETDNEAALVIAALRSRAPVIDIAPSGCVAPTIPSSLRVPPLTVKLLAVALLLFTVPVKLTVPDVIVDVMSPLKVTGP